MNCNDAIRQIAEALERGMEPQRLDALIGHLEHCVTCHRASETQLLVSQILASRPVEAVPDGFRDRLAARLDQEAFGWCDAGNWRRWSLSLIPSWRRSRF